MCVCVCVCVCVFLNYLLKMMLHFDYSLLLTHKVVCMWSSVRSSLTNPGGHGFIRMHSHTVFAVFPVCFGAGVFTLVHGL